MELTTKSFKANSEGKLDPELVSEFHPLEDHDEVVVKFKHIGGAEVSKYIDTDTKEYNFPLLFKNKVKKIEGITLKDESGNDIEVTPDVMLIVGGVVFDKIIYNTCAHLLNSYALTKEEEKNLNGDSRH